MDDGPLLRAVDGAGDLTLLDLIVVVQEFTENDRQTVEAIASLLESGRVRLRSVHDSHSP